MVLFVICGYLEQCILFPTVRMIRACFPLLMENADAYLAEHSLFLYL